MLESLILAGFGGQGIVSAGILLTYAGMVEGKKVTFFPSYGAEMRGGTANCSVVISSDEVASPVVSQATSLIVMNEPSLPIFEVRLQPKGRLFLNSSLVHSKPTRTDIEIVSIPVGEIAEELGSIKAANMIMLGAFCRKTGALTLDSLMSALPKVFTHASEKQISVNKAALQRGFSQA